MYKGQVLQLLHLYLSWAAVYAKLVIRNYACDRDVMPNDRFLVTDGLLSENNCYCCINLNRWVPQGRGDRSELRDVMRAVAQFDSLVIQLICTCLRISYSIVYFVNHVTVSYSLSIVIKCLIFLFVVVQFDGFNVSLPCPPEAAVTLTWKRKSRFGFCVRENEALHSSSVWFLQAWNMSMWL